MSLGLLFSVQSSIEFYFLVHVNQSLSCIRRCRTDLVSIGFPVFFARFLSHLLFFKLSFLEGFRSAFINSVFFFWARIVRANSNCTRVFSTCIKRSVSGCHVFCSWSRVAKKTPFSFWRCFRQSETEKFKNWVVVDDNQVVPRNWRTLKWRKECQWSFGEITGHWRSLLVQSFCGWTCH